MDSAKGKVESENGSGLGLDLTGATIQESAHQGEWMN
jgi:hypothetical protein